MMSRRLTGIGASIALLSCATPAAAHHMTGGRLPATGGEGLLSGLAHPVVGLDHFLAVLLLGVLCARLPKGMLVTAAFLTAALGGTGIHLLRLNLPAAEALVALSLVAIGVLQAVGWRLGIAPFFVFAAAAGLFHGYAYGESIVGAEPTPLVAYLVGFTLSQLAVAGAGRFLGLALQKQPERDPMLLRAFGAAGVLCGVVFLARAIA